MHSDVSFHAFFGDGVATLGSQAEGEILRNRNTVYGVPYPRWYILNGDVALNLPSLSQTSKGMITLVHTQQSLDNLNLAVAPISLHSMTPNRSAIPKHEFSTHPQQVSPL